MLSSDNGFEAGYCSWETCEYSEEDECLCCNKVYNVKRQYVENWAANSGKS